MIPKVAGLKKKKIAISTLTFLQRFHERLPNVSKVKEYFPLQPVLNRQESVMLKYKFPYQTHKGENSTTESLQTVSELCVPPQMLKQKTSPVINNNNQYYFSFNI